MTPNIDQIISILRLLLGVSGPIGALLIARGMTADQVTAFSTSLLTLVGALPPIISAVWGMFAHSDTAKIAAVTAMPDVVKIITVANPSDGVAAAVANPVQPKVVALGTPAATTA